MKNLKKAAFLAAAFTLIGLTGNAQKGNAFGVKGGVNFASAGEFRTAFFGGSNTTRSDGTNLEFGYHIGVFGKLSLGDKFYFRPELVFTKRQHNYSIVESEENESLNISSLDMPLLVGVKIVGPVSFFVGPSLHYMLDESIDSPGDLNIRDIENDLTLGINLGVAVSFNKLGIDLRYERGFGENLVSFQSDINQSFSGTIDTTVSQVILCLSYKIL
ncbi:porin family protein [Winogradskyella sp.]|uniref:porin family protein n=1 Tax=Winogradskyella sp. TaxID=1883156 RepID=UPI0026397E27|nr:porin family protein [Winogradskyella sp.]